MKIQAVQRVNISEQVFEQMKQLLLNNEWKPGEKIPSENELAGMFDVSRVTVRNALQKLVALGLIETRLGEGSYVKKLDTGNVMNVLVPMVYLGEESTLEALEFRQVIETETAGLAAKRATKEDIAELKALLGKMEAIQDDYEKHAGIDLAFHLKLAEITKNSLIIQTFNILRDVLNIAMKDIVVHMGGELGIYYHHKIIAAIEKQDSKKAMDVMREHIEKTQERYQVLLEQKSKL